MVLKPPFIKLEINMDLKDFFKKNNKIALGFSGGVDSAYLLYAAKKYGANIQAYYVKTQFQPQFELEDAKRLANEIGVKMTIIDYNILKHKKISCNSKDRCYYCKNRIFSLIKERALSDGFDIIIDGTNASDDHNDRPGIKALCELNVKSPLWICGLTKADVRRLSKEAGLFTWNKPAYACLASRININNEINENKLLKIESSENILFSMGFTDFRVRMYYNAARLQFKENEIEKAFNMRTEIYNRLSDYFDEISMDLKGR